MNDYIFYYNDGAYIIHRLSDEQYGLVVEGLKTAAHMVTLDGFGVLALNQIRAIVRQPELKDEEKTFAPDLTPEEVEYIRLIRKANELHDGYDEDDPATGGAY
ncbi:hypothetical protein D1872_90100 [compost metagenome]